MNAVQYGIKRTWFGLPLLVVRRTVPAHLAGDWEWSRWRLATLAEQFRVIEKLREIDR